MSWCSWQDGYGNLVVIDHRNGIATACTGPHLHLEVRLNGTPADPLHYLP